MIPLVIAMLVFATVLVAALAVTQRSPERQLVAVRLKELSELGMPREATLALPFTQRAVAPILQSVAKLAARLTPAGTLAAVRANLIRAGNRTTDPVVWIAWKWLRAAVVGLVVLILARRAPAGTPVLFALVAGALAYIWSEFALRRTILRRQNRIIREFPETLDLLTVTVEAGLGLDQALETVASRRAGPISDEIKVYLDEVGLGGDRRAAMKAIGTRTGVEDLVSFTSTLVRAMEFGVNIGQVLRVQSEEARVRRRQRIEERAYKAPVKMLFPLIFLILPALFVVVAGPGFVRIYTQFMSSSGSGGFGAPPGH
ncbi:MAG TPA: type II secretion system F family protein [bacterium]|nr:type II secretion system F family protein [bacterium]